MYLIKCDDLTLYDPRRDDYIVSSPTLKLELNKVGSLSFSIYPNHQHFNAINKLTSVITVYQDSTVIFKGRIFSDNVNFYKVKKVESEGLLSYFNDSIVRPYDFAGSVSEYLEFLINQHNEQVAEFQRFKLGTVTVTDPNDYIVRRSSVLPKTWAEIEDKLIKNLGGYIRIRYEDDGNYIDYLTVYNDTTSTQKIAYSINLLDLENDVSGQTFSTCIIPYGAKLSDINSGVATYATDTESEETGGLIADERVTIKDVNDGIDFIQDDEAVAKYGKIYEVVTWEDVTEPLNLLRKAREYLNSTIRFKNTLTIKAIDLHLTDETIQAFKLGDNIAVYSKPHDITETLLLTSYSLDLSNPSNFTFSLGLETDSFTDDQISADRVTSDNVQKIESVNKELGNLSDKLTQTTEETLAYINEVIENAREYTRTMLYEYAKTSDLESIEEQISTKLSQTAKDLEIAFNTTINSVSEGLNGEIVNRFEDLNAYIRCYRTEANAPVIELGASDSDIVTKILNNRWSFYQNGNEVAYISNNKLYITNAEILTELSLGFFKFMVRDNFNLSLVKRGVE